jgi:Xaa-Pro aminopeptidase
LTGYKEPNAVLVVFSNNQQTSDGKFNGIICSGENPRAEQWTGVRLGTEGAKKSWVLKMYLMDQRFLNSVDYASFDTVFL